MYVVYAKIGSYHWFLRRTPFSTTYNLKADGASGKLDLG
jgi:hypothetical protein